MSRLTNARLGKPDADDRVRASQALERRLSGATDRLSEFSSAAGMNNHDACSRNVFATSIRRMTKNPGI